MTGAEMIATAGDRRGMTGAAVMTETAEPMIGAAAAPRPKQSAMLQVKAICGSDWGANFRFKVRTPHIRPSVKICREHRLADVIGVAEHDKKCCAVRTTVGQSVVAVNAFCLEIMHNITDGMCPVACVFCR